jgi:hypothetical protein
MIVWECPGCRMERPEVVEGCTWCCGYRVAWPVLSESSSGDGGSLSTIGFGLASADSASDAPPSVAARDASEATTAGEPSATEGGPTTTPLSTVAWAATAKPASPAGLVVARCTGRPAAPPVQRGTTNTKGAA